MHFPEPPDLGPDWRARAEGRVRYEDIVQDGRMALLAFPHCIGLSVWQNLLAHKPAAHALNRAGVIPILTRMIIEGGDGPHSVRKPLSIEGVAQFAHTEDERGGVDRVMLNMWATAKAPLGRTHGPPPPRAGELVVAGRVFAEHVFTRLFAPPGQRKITKLEVEGAPPVPEHRYAWRPPEELLEAPASATWLEPEARPDEVGVVFGLMHTDSNQHVNSLVYPRMFEEAAVRRLAALGRPAALARFVEIAYRKPCFAGDRMTISMRAFELGGKTGVAGAFLPVVGGRPHATVRMLYA
jgi:hypothetical protein